MVTLESHLRVESGLVEPSPQKRPSQGIYVARTLVQDRPEVPVRVLNTSHQAIKAARSNVSNGEFQKLEEFPAEYEDIFATDSEDYRRTGRGCHRIDTGDAQLICQRPQPSFARL